MKTDSLFYELFRRWPALALDLAGLEPTAGSRYTFRSEEIKQTAFRLDGVLSPPEDSDEPWVFVEVQFQPDETLYRRLFAEIFLFLHRAPKPRPWRALVIYPHASAEHVPIGYASLLSLPEIQRIDLTALRDQERQTPGWELLRLIVDETDMALQRAQRLLGRASLDPERLDLLNFIETILIYKLPQCSREEIQSMLALTDIDLKQTRFYQDVLAEGIEEGRQEGESAMLQRLITLKFGQPDPSILHRIETADTDTLLRWAERILTATTLDQVLIPGESH